MVGDVVGTVVCDVVSTAVGIVELPLADNLRGKVEGWWSKRKWKYRLIN